ncbi:MAG: ParA family protein [Alphaproteobacteria bacterium]
MAGYVVSVAQSKGGVGKSTLTAQLAVGCVSYGYKTAIIDLDRQGSLMAWHEMRRRLAGRIDGDLSIEACSGWRLPYVLQRLRRDHDLLFVDGPSGHESEFKAMTKEADLVLIPCQPTGLDLWATKSLLADYEDVRGKALVVLNRMPPRGIPAALIRREIEKLSWPMARQHIGNRQAYVVTMGTGMGIAEIAPSSVAGQEMGALTAEILQRMSKVRLVA